MAAEEHRELVRRFYARVWAAGDVEFAREVFADDYVRHDLRPTTAAPGWQGQAEIASAFRAAFPDLVWHVDLVIGDGEFVAARWTAEGTFSGPWGERAPNGRRARFSGVNIFRFHDDKVVEIWNHRDDLGLQEQLGVPVFAGSAQSQRGDTADR